MCFTSLTLHWIIAAALIWKLQLLSPVEPSRWWGRRLKVDGMSWWKHVQLCAPCDTDRAADSNLYKQRAQQCVWAKVVFNPLQRRRLLSATSPLYFTSPADWHAGRHSDFLLASRFTCRFRFCQLHGQVLQGGSVCALVAWAEFIFNLYLLMSH